MDTPRFYSLWPSNISVSQMESLQPYNEEIYEIGVDFFKTYSASSGAFQYRVDTTSLLLARKSKGLTKLLEAIVDKVNEYLRQFYPAVDPEQLRWSIDSTVIKQDRANMRGALPHSHVGNQLIATYYPKTTFGPLDECSDQSPGALCFQDPRAIHANWMLRTEKGVLPVRPVSGTLVVFPAYLNHWTFPFLDPGSDKIAIFNKIRFDHKSDPNAGRFHSLEEFFNFQSSE